MKLLLKFLSLACLVALAFSASVEDELRLMKAQVASLDEGLIPVGYVYQQVGAEMPPQDIWPAFTWQEISDQHAGVFFRVAGGKAAAFGETQSADMPYISNVKHCNACDFDTLKAKIDMNFNTAGYSDKVRTAAKFANGVDNWSDGLSFKWTTGEIRPTNRAIKLWKRTA